MLGRSPKNPKVYKNADDMWQHLSKKEVPFNHILNLFFSLFPLDKMPFMRLSDKAEFYSSARLEEGIRSIKGGTQPDIFIEDKDKAVAIELKVGSKSSLDQIEKYKAFSKHVCDKPLTLVYLAPKSDKTLISKQHEAVDDIEIVYINFRDFHKDLRKIYKHCNRIEQKLIGGVISYMEMYFSEYLE